MKRWIRAGLTTVALATLAMLLGAVSFQQGQAAPQNLSVPTSMSVGTTITISFQLTAGTTDAMLSASAGTGYFEAGTLTDANGYNCFDSTIFTPATSFAGVGTTTLAWGIAPNHCQSPYGGPPTTPATPFSGTATWYCSAPGPVTFTLTRLANSQTATVNCMVPTNTAIQVVTDAFQDTVDTCPANVRIEARISTPTAPRWYRTAPTSCSTPTAASFRPATPR